jgi:hypothetical protein
VLQRAKAGGAATNHLSASRRSISPSHASPQTAQSPDCCPAELNCELMAMLASALRQHDVIFVFSIFLYFQ